MVRKQILICAMLPVMWTLSLTGCTAVSDRAAVDTPRMSLFIGMDISGSFMNGPHFDDSIEFLSHYIYAHLNGIGGAEKPKTLFVSSIGGARANEPKTFFPIQTFENKSVEEIGETLREMFPRDQPNPFTDYNAFFEQVSYTVRSKNLVLRPITIVMLSDGIPDVERDGRTDYGSVVVEPLERLARSVTVRLLYTSAVVGKSWQTEVSRKRVKIWTQDAEVMASWKDPKIMLPEQPLDEQQQFFAWMEDNVDFGVRARRVE